MTVALWWIRRDLRLHDNPALRHALNKADHVVPVFVLDERLEQSEYLGAKRFAFLYGALRSLETDLRERGARLILRRGTPIDALTKLVEETKASLIAVEEDYSPYAIRRDALIRSSLPLEPVSGTAIRPPGSVLKTDGSPYVVYTPFKNTWLDQSSLAEPLPAPDHIPTLGDVASESIPSEPILPASVPFPPSEDEARHRLDAFLADGLFQYDQQRDRMAIDGTSRLSPYFRFGLLSAHEAISRAFTTRDQAPSQEARDNAQVWISELIWRDFYIHILAQFPRVRQRSFRIEYDAIEWRNNETEFVAWCEGRTGYPIVDAAMRQLVESGWMHNRARMIVASFLVKDLLIDWRWGERFFMQHLVDGDPAANNGGWQWAAGTGTDAAPYFRIFNPTTQGKKHDPKGDYIRRWLPELREVPTNRIHQPATMTPMEQQAANCIIGQDYPAPIVDHKMARQRTLDAYKAVKA
ncbi:MAG: deoxyribodipyrimidine photo-lyase [Chloroflexi bacterium]|nr:deoxyribodipyrimidine photo-lyase [Chloroflexota bacterium]